MNQPSDERLVERAANGDEHAFALLYDRYCGRLLSFSRYLLGSREEAQDAVQQTFMRAHRAFTAGNAPDDLRPWLYTVARNRCRSILAARRDRELPVDEIAEHAALDGLGDVVQRREDLRALVRDLDRLPEDQRAALVLFELGDLSQRDVAGVLDVPEPKVKALVHQARTHLIAERAARERSCDDVRAELAVAKGAALRRGPLRRHVRSCPACKAWQSDIGSQRAALALVLPVAFMGSRDAALTALGVGAAGAGAATAGGAGAVGAGSAASGVAAAVGAAGGAGLATKLVAGVAALGIGAAGAGVVVSATGDPAADKPAVTRDAGSSSQSPGPAGVPPQGAVPAAATTPGAQPSAKGRARAQTARRAARERKLAKTQVKEQRHAAREARKAERAAAKAEKADGPKPAKRAGSPDAAAKRGNGRVTTGRSSTRPKPPPGAKAPLRARSAKRSKAPPIASELEQQLRGNRKGVQTE